MQDVVLVASKDGVIQFWRSTFFDNSEALRCQLAAMTLVLRGCNITRAFWTIGPGGVGQRMNSVLIANLFGELHAYMDMNIFFTQEELRKQAGLMTGKVPFSGVQDVCDLFHADESSSSDMFCSTRFNGAGKPTL